MNRADIVVGGDLCPFGGVAGPLAEGDVEAVFHDLLPVLRDATFALVNLECPLTDVATPIAKAGPVYAADPHCAPGLRHAGIRAVNLANNHIMDHGADGLRRTIRACAAAGIEVVGAGRNLAEASRLLVRDIDGLRVAFLGMAEREFSIAGTDAWGAQPLDLIDFLRILRDSRDTFDRLVVLLHGGAELYPLASPGLQRTCRFLVDQGAHAVICQHSHCAGAWESYRGAPIVYGQGNLLHDLAGVPDMWYSGYLVRLSASEGAPGLSMELVPYEGSRQDGSVRRMAPAAGELFLAGLRRLGEKLADPVELEHQWLQFCREQRASYFSHLRGHGRWMRRINRYIETSRFVFSRDDLLALLDLFRSDTHREALEAILNDESGRGRRATHPRSPR